MIKNDPTLTKYVNTQIRNILILGQSEIFHKRFIVKCLICGTVFEIGIKTLLDGYVSECCMTTLNPKRKNLSTQTFSNLLVLRPCGKYKRKILYLVECQCEFKTKFVLINEDIEYGMTVSCRHDEHINGLYINNNLPIYKIYDSIIQRCYNPNSAAYSNYGLKGIKLLPQWEPPNGLRGFIDYVNENLGWPIYPDLSIDRIDNSLGYIPNNIRWATKSEQVRNRSITKLTEIDAQNIRNMYSTKKYTYEQIATMFNVSKSLVNNILNNVYWT